MIHIVVPSCKNLSEKVLLSLSAMENTKPVFLCTEEDYEVLRKNEAAFGYIGQEDTVLRLKGEPAGPLCSCLMAIDEIDNDEAVLVLDQTIDREIDFSRILEQFADADCGVVTIDSDDEALPHVLLDKDTKEIIEASQNRVLSNRASVGVYYFKHGTDLLESGKNAIRKGCSVENRYYITAAVNEMILKNSKVMELPLL